MTLGSMGLRIDWDDDSLRSEGPIDTAGIPTTMRAHGSPFLAILRFIGLLPDGPSF